MNSLRSLLSTASLLLFFITSASDLTPGKWIGTFTFQSGTEYIMMLDIKTVGKNDFQGTVYWPDYFNSAASIEGSIRKKQLSFREKQLLQGIEMNMDSRYGFILAEDGTLTGTSGAQGKTPAASFRLSNYNNMPPSLKLQWDNRLSEEAEKWGTAVIQEEIPMAQAQELLDQYRRVTARFDSIMSSLSVWGTAETRGLTMPIYIVFLNPEMYMEIALQKAKFIQVNTDSLNWSYNPSNDRVTITSQEEGNSSGVFGDAVITSKAKITQANAAEVNGQQAIRLKIEDQQSSQILFFNPSADLLRKETYEDIEDYEGYYTLDNVSIPRSFKKVSLDDHMVINLDSVVLNLPISTELFEIPANLKSKVYKDQNEDNLNEAGNELYKEGKYEEAIAQYNQAIQVDGNRFIFFYNRGSAYLELDNHYSAIADFTRSIELNPKYKQAWNQRGEAKSNLGDQSSAIADFKQSLELDPMYEDALLNLGIAQYNLEEYQDAIESFRALTSLDSTNGLYQYNLAYTYSQASESSLAIPHFKLALQNGHDLVNTNNMIGISYYRLEDYASATTYFREVVSLEGNNPVYLLNLGKSYYEIDSLEKAINYISESLKLSAENDDALNHLGLSYYKQGDYGSAITYFTEAIKFNPDNAYYFDNRAFAKAGMMNYTGAVADFTESIDLYSKDPEVYYNRGMMNINLNNKFDACRDFRKASEMGMTKADEAIEENCSLLPPAKPD